MRLQPTSYGVGQSYRQFHSAIDHGCKRQESLQAKNGRGPTANIARTSLSHHPEDGTQYSTYTTYAIFARRDRQNHEQSPEEVGGEKFDSLVSSPAPASSDEGEMREIIEHACHWTDESSVWPWPVKHPCELDACMEGSSLARSRRKTGKTRENMLRTCWRWLAAAPAGVRPSPARQLAVAKSPLTSSANWRL